jgi:hypothetical protein
MARSPEYEPLYEAFEQFLNRCILSDESLLWPTEAVWTAENVAEVKHRTIDSPVLGSELSFEEKLQQQMKGAPSQQWMLLADVYYVYFLPSSFITLDKKKNDILWVAQQAGVAPPADSAEIWKAQTCGFTRTSLRYHYKYAQFWFILLLVDRLKQLDDPRGIVDNPQAMQEVLDDILDGIPEKNDRAYDMRHAMLYLTFPDQYERIISTRDKERILKAYGDQIEAPVPDDLDEAVRQIRVALSTRFDEADRPFDFYRDLKNEWRPTRSQVAEEEALAAESEKVREEEGAYVVTQGILETDDLASVMFVLDRTRNVILYGPPGTGKTYIAKKVAEALVEPQTRQPLSRAAAIRAVIEEMSWYEILALSMYVVNPGGSWAVSEIANQPIVNARTRLVSMKRPRDVIWTRLQEHTSPESSQVNVSARREPYLFDKDDQSCWTLTETGRRYVEENLAEEVEALGSSEKAQHRLSDFVMWATFHQSYAYEDFVEGLRPVPSDEMPGDVAYEIVPGVFRRICSRADGDPDNKYVLVIDEINRGNIAKILGELITLLEDDKREGEMNALDVTLPYSGDTFSVPANLYIVGTMNTTDRSIALLDVALRRRFAFVELMPRPELLDGAMVESSEAVVPLERLLRSLNQGIRRYLDRDHQIGHSYFLEVAQASKGEQVDVLEFVWNNKIVPLLEEYFYSQRDRLAELLAPFRTDVEPDLEAAQETGFDFEIGRQTGDDLVIALAKLAERGG